MNAETIDIPAPSIDEEQVTLLGARIGHDQYLVRAITKSDVVLAMGEFRVLESLNDDRMSRIAESVCESIDILLDGDLPDIIKEAFERTERSEE